MVEILVDLLKAAANSGLLQWLLPDFPTENPLLNGMFCYICNGLVLHLRHNFKPQNVVHYYKKKPNDKTIIH